MIDWAIYYRKLGLAVHPLHPGQKRPIHAEWTTLPVPSVEQIPGMFTSRDNLGFRPGAWSRVGDRAIVVIDVDIRREDAVAPAMAAVTAFLGGDITAYPRVQSSQRSMHLYATVRADSVPESRTVAKSVEQYHCTVTGRTRRVWEVSYMATGSNIVLPPSINPDSGTRYTWVDSPPQNGIPPLPETALASLSAPRVAHHRVEDQPDILPEADLPAISTLLLSASQKRSLVQGESYLLTGDRGEAIMGLASLLLLQGLDRQVVLSLLYHNAPGQIAQEPPHSARDPATWLWRYGMCKVLSHETDTAYQTYQRRRNPVANEEGEGEEDEWEVLLDQTRKCSPLDPDRAVLLYHNAIKTYGALRGAMVADILRDLGFPTTALKADAKLRGKELSRLARQQSQPEAPSYPHGDAWLDPAHPMYTGIFTSPWDAVVARYIFLPNNNQWFDLHTRMTIKPAGLDMKLAHDIRHLLAADGVDMDEIPRNPRATEYLVNRPNLVEVDGETFYPGVEGPIVEWEGLHYLNRWQRPQIDLSEPVGDSRVRTWLDHVARLFPSDADREALYDWLAYVVQHPEEKINWQLVVGGTSGCGKDTIWNQPMRWAIGDRYVSDVPFSEISTPYHEWRSDKKLVIVQESTQNKRTDWVALENELKSICAAPPESLPINLKYGGKSAIPNKLALIFTTNHRDGFLVEGMRRYHFLWTDAPARSEQYFDDLYAWLEGGGAQSVARWLYQRNLTPRFSPKHPPARTEWGESVIYAGVSPTQKKIRDAVDVMTAQGRDYVTPEQIRDYLKAEDAMIGEGFIPHTGTIVSVLQGFGMRPLLDQLNRPEIDVPKALLTTGGVVEGDLVCRRTCVFPLRDGIVRGSPYDVWRGLCPPSSRSDLEKLLPRTVL